MVSYIEDLNQRFWEYRKSHFPDSEEFFDSSYTENVHSSPVFIKEKADLNVITRPNADEAEKKEFFLSIPKQGQHRWYRSMRSSQALVQSIVANLSFYNSLEYLADLKDDDGMNLFDNVTIAKNNLLIEHRIKYLNEPRPSSIDFYISGDYQIAVECKFTESEIGTCSRPRLTQKNTNYDRYYCNGSYTFQRKRKERCSLSELGVAYWTNIPKIFDWQVDIDRNVCPLHKNYQLVRNILAACVKSDGTVSPKNGHAILIYDDRNPAFINDGKGIVSFYEVKQALKVKSTLRKCSWQSFISQLKLRNVLPWLTKSVYEKYGI